MQTDKPDAPAVRVPPPLVYLAAVLAGWFLNAFVLPLPMALPTPLRIAGSVVLILPGGMAAVAALRLFRQAKQDPTPWKPTTEIVSTGIYRFTRNPMYLGLALMLAGLSIAMANLWLIALLPPVLVVIHATAIRHEEAYLEQEFGERYLDYKRSVRRWI